MFFIKEFAHTKDLKALKMGRNNPKLADGKKSKYPKLLLNIPMHMIMQKWQDKNN